MRIMNTQSLDHLIMERCFTIPVSGVSSQINAQLNPFHIFVFSYIYKVSVELIQSFFLAHFNAWHYKGYSCGYWACTHQYSVIYVTLYSVFALLKG